MHFSTRSRRSSRLAACGIVFALVAAGCSGDDDAEDTSTDETTEESSGATDDGTAESTESSDAGTADGADDAALDEAGERAEAAEAEAAAAQAEAEQLATDLEAAQAQAAEAEAQVADTTETLEALAAAETIRADTAETEVERFSDLFPIEVESTLAGIELDQAGTYNLVWNEAYCDTFTTCGTVPRTTQATFTRTPDNFLRVQVPGILDAGLFSVNGSLYAITDSTTALPPCEDGSGPRVARITITTYADDIRIESDGSRSVTGLEGAITIDSTSRTGCPGGLVFYGVQMNKVG
jgi:multidrug efflux pump subunit AcrA (membrane-fusion protein)